MMDACDKMKEYMYAFDILIELRALLKWEVSVSNLTYYDNLCLLLYYYYYYLCACVSRCLYIH